MLSKRLIDIVKFVFNSDSHQVETYIKYIHFNRKCGLTGNEKRLLARIITAKLTIIQSMVKIDKAITALGLDKSTTTNDFRYLQGTGDKNDSRALRTIKKYFKEVKERGVKNIADEFITELMSESEYLKEQRPLIFEGIDIPTEQPLQSPTSTNNDIAMKYINPEVKSCKEQINHKQYKDYSDEELGIKSLQQMKREKHFLDSYDTVVMNYWHLRRDALERLKNG